MKIQTLLELAAQFPNKSALIKFHIILGQLGEAGLELLDDEQRICYLVYFDKVTALNKIFARNDVINYYCFLFSKRWQFSYADRDQFIEVMREKKHYEYYERHINRPKCTSTGVKETKEQDTGAFFLDFYKKTKYPETEEEICNADQFKANQPALFEKILEHEDPKSEPDDLYAEPVADDNFLKQVIEDYHQIKDTALSNILTDDNYQEDIEEHNAVFIKKFDPSGNL